MNDSLINHPAANDSRLDVMDFLRGIAILGMLVANVPWHVGNSMSRVIEADTTSVLTWLLQYLIFDQRFMPIFCFLFGAGFCILAERASSLKAFRIHYIKRMMALLLIGVLHAYILWPGDILITYAVCGLLLPLFASCSIKMLIFWGCLFKAINLAFGQWPDLYHSTLGAWLFAWWLDYGEAPMSIVQAYGGSYADLFSYNAWRNQFLQWSALPYFRVWNSLGLMLIGMALYKTGILQGDKPRIFYWRMLWVTLMISIPLILYGVLARIGINTSVGPYLGFTDELPLYNLTFRLGCLVGSLTLLAAIHLCWAGISSRFKKLIQPVGKMALSNYILQSVFFLLVAHVFGLFTFDSLDHDEMLGLVCIMWLIHLSFSSLWQSRFSKGPVEYVYKRLFSR